MGAYPEEEEEPSDGQLSALNRRTIVLGQAPYVDFSVWTPYARRALRTQKFRTYVPLGDGSFLMKELPGPQNLQQWMACWRVFKVAALALGILSMASLQLYEKLMEKLTLQYPSAWGLICLADDRARAERWEKIRRGLLADRAAGKSMPDDWNEDSPWTCCLVKLAKDDQYWSEQVRHPATAWIAAGGKGAPVAPAENIASSHHPGGQESLQPPKEDVKDERRKQANRDKRMARRKRVRDDRDELDKLRGNKSAAAGSKGSSKGKSKDSSGAEICFSWAQGKGACADVPVGGECKNKLKRSHRCQFCLSPGHRNDACPQKWLAVEKNWVGLRLGFTPGGLGSLNVLFCLVGKSFSLVGKQLSGVVNSSASCCSCPQGSALHSAMAETDEVDWDPADCAIIEKEWRPGVLELLRNAVDFSQFKRERTFRFVHLFSGPKDILKEAILEEAGKEGLKVEVESYDKEGPNKDDLGADKPYVDLVASADSIDGFHSGFPCSSFSRVRHREGGGPPPVRDRASPYGLESNDQGQQAEADRGTVLAVRSTIIGAEVLENQRKCKMGERATF